MQATDGFGIEMEAVNCPLCGARDEAFLFNARDRLHGLPGTFRVVQCRKCELIYLNPRPTQEGLKNYYPRQYRGYRSVGKRGKKRSRHVAYRKVLQYYYDYPTEGHSHVLRRMGWKLLLLPALLRFRLDRRNSMVIPFQGEGRILDIGCGSGRFLDIARVHGWEVYGTEIDEEVVSALRSLGFRVFQGDILEAPYPNEYFDVVLMSHVLEHLAEPVRAVRKVYSLLKRGGRFYVRIPDAGAPTAKTFRDKWFHLDAPRHLCSFTRRTLRRLLEETGFLVEDMKQDRSAIGVKYSLRYAGRERPSLLTRLSHWKHLMRFVGDIVFLAGAADAMIVRARKP